MADEKRRILELFYILAKQNDFVSSIELAQLVKVTERTIKSDIKDLEQFTSSSGGRIHSKKGRGYLLEVVNESVFFPVLEQLSYLFEANKLVYARNMYQRTNDILRRIVVEEEFITIEDIAEELYLTKNSIAEEMKEVHRILDTYNLRIRKKQEEGPFVQGDEFNRRLLMIRVFEVHFHKAVSSFKYTEYQQYFEREEEERYAIRHEFLDVLRETKTQVIDEFTQRMSRYLLLLSNRFQKGYYISFSEEEKQFIQSFPRFKTSELIMQRLKKFKGFNVDENEVYGLALLLLMWADIDGDTDMKLDYQLVYDEAKVLAEKGRAEILKEYQIDIAKIKKWENILLTALIPITIQLKFSSCAQSVFTTQVISDDVRHSPFSIALAQAVVNMLKIETGSNMSLLNLLLLANRFYIIISYVGYDYKKMRLLLTSSNGIESAKFMREEIMHRAGRYFEKIDLCELYEMRKLSVDDYDWVVLNAPYFTYNYDWPYLLVDVILTQKQMNDIYNQIILDGVKLMPLVNKMDVDEILVYRDFKFEDASNFYKLLSFKIGKTNEEVEKIGHYLAKIPFTSSFNRVSVQFIPYTITNKELIEIYQLEKPAYLGFYEVELIVVISLNFAGNLQLARMIEQFTNEWTHDPEQLWVLLENPRKEFLIETVKKKLRAHPISLV